MADQSEPCKLEGDALHSEAADCARYGEAEELRQALAAGADVNWKGPGGNTALHMVSSVIINVPCEHACVRECGVKCEQENDDTSHNFIVVKSMRSVL